MGRVESSKPRNTQAASKPDRAKRAREILNKIIPALLASNPRAKNGVGSAELIVSTNPGISANISGRSVFDLRIRLVHTNTLSAAAELYQAGKKGARIAILNMASLLRPGGGFLTGATSQEEFLCMRTTLLPSLHEHLYRLPEEGVVYSPDILVFRNTNGDDLPKAQRFYLDVLTAAMLRSPDLEGERYSNEADREIAIMKTRAVLRGCVAKGVNKVVLGAWGCGAYGNPIVEIAQAWRRVILGVDSKGRTKSKEVWERLEEIVFAITEAKKVAAFGDCFNGFLAEEMKMGCLTQSLQKQ